MSMGMLVLSRKEDEVIVIGEGDDAVRITVVDIDPRGKVRLGIDAPREVIVMREELLPLRPREGGG